VDARNKTFVDADRDQPLSVVLNEVKATRHRMLHQLHRLSKIPSPAARHAAGRTRRCAVTAGGPPAAA
jgi:hypothetical protein